MKINRKYFNVIKKPWTHELSGSQTIYHFLDDFTFEPEPVEVGHGFFIDYGVKHFTDEGFPAEGMNESKYTPMKSPDWAASRKIYPPFLPEGLVEEVNLEVLAINEFWNTIVTARKFQSLNDSNNEDCLEARTNLLVNFLGFIDTGISVGDDLQFVYQFSYKWQQVEIYLSNKDRGVVTELVFYNQQNKTEVRFPIRSVEPLMYLFILVRCDLYGWDFNKLELLEEDEYWVKEFKNPSNFDYIPTSNFIKYILDGGLILHYPK
jgi:hypothetical protein